MKNSNNKTCDEMKILINSRDSLVRLTKYLEDEQGPSTILSSTISMIDTQISILAKDLV